jgi:hypothetical protein
MIETNEHFLALAAVAISFFAFGLGYAARWFHEGWTRRPTFTMDDECNPFMRRFN